MPGPGGVGSSGQSGQYSLPALPRPYTMCQPLGSLKAHGAKTPAYLHGIQRQVAGKLKPLHQDLFPDVIKAHKLGHASCQNVLPIRRVAQGSESPGRKTQFLKH